MIQLDNFRCAADVVARQVGDETMLLDLVSGTYFGLDPVGGRFWELLETGNTPTKARDVLLEEFDVEPAVLDRDLSSLIEQLSNQRLIETTI